MWGAGYLDSEGCHLGEGDVLVILGVALLQPLEEVLLQIAVSCTRRQAHHLSRPQGGERVCREKRQERRGQGEKE